MLKKSVVLPGFFKKSIIDSGELANGLKTVQNRVDTVELYYEGDDRKLVKEELARYNLSYIYLGAMATKRQKMSITSLNNDHREEALQVVKKCIDDAYYYGAESMIINSGSAREEGKEIDFFNTLLKSLEELLSYAKDRSSDYLLHFLLEPGDTDIQSFDFIGRTELAIEVVKKVNNSFDNLSLTLDTSHLRQLGEDPLRSVIKAKDYCHHIHLANCVIKDELSPYYGDKHPEFGVEGGEIDWNTIKKLSQDFSNLYEEERLTVGLEIITQGKIVEEDYYEKIIEKMGWK